MRLQVGIFEHLYYLAVSLWCVSHTDCVWKFFPLYDFSCDVYYVFGMFLVWNVETQSIIVGMWDKDWKLEIRKLAKSLRLEWLEDCWSAWEDGAAWESSWLRQ